MTFAEYDAAWVAAALRWNALVRTAGWPQAALAGAHATLGLLCLGCAHTTQRAGGDRRGWRVAAVAAMLLGANVLWRIDYLALETLRELARAQGWYPARRQGQYLLLVSLGALALAALAGLRARIGARWRDSAPAVVGLGVLVALAALRAVSFHYTDAILDARFAGVSAGRLLDAGALLLAAAGTLRWLRVH